MYVLFGDETDYNREGNAPFFIYGAVFIPLAQAHALHGWVEYFRSKHGFRPRDALKFSSARKPAHIEKAAHTEIKKDVIAKAGELGVKFCANAVLHELARNQVTDDLIRMGANTILGAFNTYLNEENSHGLVFLDKLPIAQADDYLKEKFQVGLTFPNGSNKRLERILGAFSSCDSASHFSSVADIVLGSFRFCVNEVDKDKAPREMLPPIVKMMWHKNIGGQIDLRDRGLILRPKEIREERLKQKYAEMLTRLQSFLQPLALPAPI